MAETKPNTGADKGAKDGANSGTTDGTATGTNLTDELQGTGSEGTGSEGTDKTPAKQGFEPKTIFVKIDGISTPIRTLSQNPVDAAKKKKGMVCMQTLKPTLVKSITTGLTYIFPELSPVWVHPKDVNLCGGQGAAPYKEIKQ